MNAHSQGLMLALREGAESNNAFADRMKAYSDVLWGEERATEAGAFRTIARLHRVQAIVLRAQFGELKEIHGILPTDGGR